MIKKQGNKFVVTNKAGTKVLGTHPSKEKAQKQLAAIEISKAKHMHENKSFKSFRSTLNESEYSEVLTGYGNRSAHKDDAGLHHLQSAGALAGINAMLATISKGTYLNPNEAFLKMKVRLNVVQLDFPWKPGSWDGGVGSFDIPVVQFGRVDGYDAQTGQIRFDGKANPTGGYTELNLHVEVELNADSLYTVSAKLSPAVPVAEEVEVAEDYQTPDRAKEMRNKYKDAWLQGDTAARKVKSQDAAEKSSQTHIYYKGGKKSKVAEDYQTPDRAKEMRNKYKDAWLQGDTAARKVKSQDAAEKSSQTHIYYKGGKKSKLAPLSQKKKGVNEDLQTPAREREMDRKIAKHDDAADSAYRTRMTKYGKVADRASKSEDKHDKAIARLLKRSQKEQESFRTYGRSGKLVKRGSRAEVKEEMEQIDEAGAAKLARMGYAYDRARVGARGVLNPERKKQMGDAYYKQREKMEANKAKRVAAGTFDKGRELEALHKKYEIRRAKNTVKEALIGGQKKLDLNKNKRLDSHDFAMLRAKKKAMSEAKKPMIKIGLNPNKKIGYEVASIGAGGKKTVEKSVDYTMPHVRRDTTKKGVNEAKMKIWSPRLDRLMANRDAIRSRPKKSILTQKVQDGKKKGAARPIAKYEGK